RPLHLTPIGNGRTQPLILLAGQGHTDGFTPDFTRPLEAGPARSGSPVLHVAFTNPAYFGQRRLKSSVLRLPAGHIRFHEKKSSMREIGRASCRERVYKWVVQLSLNKKISSSTVIVTLLPRNT